MAEWHAHLRRHGSRALLWVWLIVLAVMRLGISFLGALGGLLLFMFLAFFMMRGATQRFDEAVINYFRTHQPPWLREPVLWITKLANGEVVGAVTVIACAYFAWRNRWRVSASLLITVAGGWAVIEGLKSVFNRPRPEGALEAGLSFPSGHAFFSLTLYGFLAYRLAREAPVRSKRLVWSGVIAVAILVGTTRMLLGVHYPSDVMAGFAAAAGWLWGCLKLPKILRRADWRGWREERFRQLQSAKEALSAAGPEAPRLEQAAHALLQSGTLGRRQRGVLRSAVWAAHAVPGRWVDAIVLAEALRFVERSERHKDAAPLTTVQDTVNRIVAARRSLMGPG